MRKVLTFGIIMLCLMLLFGCGKGKDENNEADNDGMAGEAKQNNRYPFTGMYTDEDVSHRAVAIMVSNQKQARPQSGLAEADIIFEFLTEGNITRYMALYHSEKPDRVGPVRSAREYFFTLADYYGAIYMYQGAANFVNEMIAERQIEHIQGLHYDNDGKVFVREDFRVTPHNSYVIFDGVYDTAIEKGYDITFDHTPLDFLETDDVVTGEDANYVKIDYYGGTPIMEFTYDAAMKKYTQTMDRDVTRDLQTDEAIAVDNLFIIETDHEVIDKDLRRRIDIDSGGNAYLLRHGKVEYVQWENRDGYIVPVKDGEIVPFVQGKTWISIVQTKPESGVIEQVVIEDREE